MADRLLTLCPDCRRLYEESGFRTKTVTFTSTTDKKNRCDRCGKRFDRSLMKQVIVSRK